MISQPQLGQTKSSPSRISGWSLWVVGASNIGTSFEPALRPGQTVARMASIADGPDRGASCRRISGRTTATPGRSCRGPDADHPGQVRTPRTHQGGVVGDTGFEPVTPRM